MRIAGLAALAPIGLALLLLLPGSLATAPTHGLVTTCLSASSCKFTFNTTLGTGWATAYPPTMSIQLPGESHASFNLSYATYIARLTGTYTYWTVGNFVGTDVNTGKVIYGTTDTNYTITAHCTRGCSYTYTTDNGTIVVRYTRAELTATSIACTPYTLHPGGKSTCTVTVTNLWNVTNYPTGNVRVSDARLGSLTNKGVCTLVSGTCSVTYKAYDNTCGGVGLSATYAGSASFYKSGGSTSVDVVVSGGC